MSDEPTGKFAERAHRHHALVHQFLEQGHGIRGIARRLGWGRHTVQRYARAAHWTELLTGQWASPRPSKLDPFKPYLDQRIADGRRNARQLHREITERGFDGSYAIVSTYVAAHRPTPAPIPPSPPTVREVTASLLRHPDHLAEEEHLLLKSICARCPELNTLTSHVRSFATMLTTLTGQDLPTWIEEVSGDNLPGVSTFAKGLRQDLSAVIQGLTTPWNSGPVEGVVNKIKMLKRQMFGRAGTALLRKRIMAERR
ncbi:transposase [Nonomuraea fuscirosea]|uniref:transposase n=1 Tax=Nonomuraea fuscirosea TaxID=1291556 RepID=UPI0033E03B05